MTQVNFNAAEVPPADDFAPLPEGNYTAEIVESERVQTKDGAGAFLKLTFRVIGLTHGGRKLFHRLNMWNKSTKAVEIAQQQLSAICHAVGIIQITDSQQLHGRPMAIRVKVKDGYNEISGFKPATEAAHTMQAAPAPAAKTAAPPWARKDTDY